MIAVYSVVLSWCSFGLRSSPEFRILHQILLSFFYHSRWCDYLDIEREAYLRQIVQDLPSDGSSIAGLNQYVDCYLRCRGLLSVRAGSSWRLSLYRQAWRCGHSAYIVCRKETVLESRETVCFHFFPVGRAFIGLRELASFRWSRQRDVATVIKLSKSIFQVISRSKSYDRQVFWLLDRTSYLRCVIAVGKSLSHNHSTHPRKGRYVQQHFL